jgi:hypothetical protein
VPKLRKKGRKYSSRRRSWRRESQTYPLEAFEINSMRGSQLCSLASEIVSYTAYDRKAWMAATFHLLIPGNEWGKTVKNCTYSNKYVKVDTK